ncbi:MAG TPA: hypothetical protein VLA82_04035 [Actinomycetota bacterium]|nr:hypothetical protein [Actinomycetota bacterium]
MDDLETRLKDLFEADASRAPLVGTAPPMLRPRVRRRQVRSAIAGTTAMVVVVGVIGAGAWAGLSRREVPAGNDDPMRVTVDRFTIDVPSGWTALDTSFTPLVMATESETCSYAAEGVPVTGGATDAAQEVEAPSEERERCSTEPIPYPAGLPLLQLTQRDVADIDGTECSSRLGEAREDTTSNPFSGDGSGFYLALLPDVTGLPAWPVGLEHGEGPCGEGSYARFSVGDESYLAFAGFGPDVGSEQRDALLQAIASMDVHEATRPDRELPIAGPAVFLASGELDGTRWQISAGIALDARMTNEPTAWAELVSSDGTITDTLTVPSAGGRPTGASIGVDDRQIAVALVPDGLDAAWESDDGTVTELTTAAAPAIMTLPPTPFSGRVGWAVAPGTTGTLARTRTGDEPTPVAGPSASAFPSPIDPVGVVVDGPSDVTSSFAYWTTIERSGDAWRLDVHVGDEGEVRGEADLVWSGLVPRSTTAADGRSLNAVVVDVSDRSPGDAIIALAFVPTDAAELEVDTGNSSSGIGLAASPRHDALRLLGETGPVDLVGFATSLVGGSFGQTATVSALGANGEPILQTTTAWRADR